MRKIEQQMTAAIRDGRNWRGGNTTVEVSGHKADLAIDVYLHGNRIACYNTVNGWRVSLAGWNTATTRSRLHSLLAETGDNGLCSRGGRPHLIRNLRGERRYEPITSTDWHAI